MIDDVLAVKIVLNYWINWIILLPKKPKVMYLFIMVVSTDYISRHWHYTGNCVG